MWGSQTKTTPFVVIGHGITFNPVYLLRSGQRGRHLCCVALVGHGVGLVSVGSMDMPGIAAGLRCRHR